MNVAGLDSKSANGTNIPGATDSEDDCIRQDRDQLQKLVEERLIRGSVKWCTLGGEIGCKVKVYG